MKVLYGGMPATVIGSSGKTVFIEFSLGSGSRDTARARVPNSALSMPLEIYSEEEHKEVNKFLSGAIKDV